MNDNQKVTIGKGGIVIVTDIPEMDLINSELYTVEEIISFVDAWMRFDNGVVKLGAYVEPLVVVE